MADRRFTEIRHEGGTGSTVPYTEYHCPRLGGVFPLEHAAEGISEVSRARDELVQLEKEAQALADDPTLSDEGRAQKLAPKREELALRNSRRLAALDIEAQLHASEVAKAYALPVQDAPRRADAAERRKWYNELSPDRKSALKSEMEPGEFADLMVDLAQGPVPTYCEPRRPSTFR